ncbi:MULTISPECIES: hypothetical protein [Aeromonas]|uniref:Uncharacterized protein n=1 Tax=Aeromonas enteropelogenes TaxID=29489 RepID=A0A175VG80_AEREN|nr:MULTISPECIES: hypothetical protein [Aeromonas]KHA56016.1 hypothetical protein NM74_13655 [Aeromonas hydrophila]KXU79714.1 hypothetical protein LCR_16455 [Aeromonas enteropelogenes]MBS4673562.1 hypothetical protein [Aeromonas hydrophila]OOD34564.1 hypothetical protein BWP11_06760 [Aeromonas hydrophila]QXC35348.1 hypothetical protein I6L37_06755 [Aeromonas sp. FDAARGOS 1407]
MSDKTKDIREALAEALIHAEEKGDLVITTSVIDGITVPMAEAIKTVYAGMFTTHELSALSNLAFHATQDANFYDWEMPTLIGLSREEMQSLGEKLRDLT